MRQRPAPGFVPILARGRHRRPASGACFMEFASYLAGERWSDHPSCTHPVLAALARAVNDVVGDEPRQRLVLRVPDVIGLTSDDPCVAPLIARQCALAAAIPSAPVPRQRITALALLHAERTLNGLRGDPLDELSAVVEEALAQAPSETAWAREYLRSPWVRPLIKESTRASCAAARSSVETIAEHWVGDPDDRLVGLLEDTIDRCRVWTGAASTASARATIGAAGGAARAHPSSPAPHGRFDRLRHLGRANRSGRPRE